MLYVNVFFPEKYKLLTVSTQSAHSASSYYKVLSRYSGFSMIYHSKKQQNKIIIKKISSVCMKSSLSGNAENIHNLCFSTPTFFCILSWYFCCICYTLQDICRFLNKIFPFKSIGRMFRARSKARNVREGTCGVWEAKKLIEISELFLKI